MLNRKIWQSYNLKMTIEELEKKMAAAASVIKLVCGVGNNAAWLVALEAYDHARQCRRYGKQTKGGHLVSWHFKRAAKAFHLYERELRFSDKNRMFHLDDMDEQARRRYGDITDNEYYDFWASLGGPAYTKTRPLITSLWNKYRLSLLNHKIADAEHIAWVMTAQASLELSCTMYERALQECETGYNLPRKLLDYVFRQFSLRSVVKLWYDAMLYLAPEIEPIQLEPTEEKNIEVGLRQLMEAWLAPDLLYDSTSDTVEDFDDIFRTRGFQKKTLREIAEIRHQTKKNL